MNAPPRPLGGFRFGGPIAGMWLFAHQGRVHLGVFDRDRGESRSTLTFLRLDDESVAVELRRIENDGTSIRAIDARVVGEEMRFVLEVNRGDPLQLTSAPLPALLDPAAQGLAFSAMRPIGPWPQLADRIHLDTGDLWNVADGLAPKQWLFSPRFSAGAPGGSLVVNTADGQALLLSDEGAPGGLLPDAASPQRLDHPALRIVAFQRTGRPYRPFWALSRYSPPRPAPPGQLWVVEAAMAPRNLSAELKLGAVISFALAEGPRTEPWLLALTRTPKGVVVSTLQRQAKGWVIGPEWPVDTGATGIAALWHGNAWHLVLAHGEPATSLHYLRRS